MLFPMYTVAVETLLRMTAVQPHEELKAGAFYFEDSESRRSFSNFTGSLSIWP